MKFDKEVKLGAKKQTRNKKLIIGIIISVVVVGIIVLPMVLGGFR